VDEQTTYLVLRECVLPGKNGGMVTLRAGQRLHDSHYEQYLGTGLIRKEQPVSSGPAPTETPQEGESSSAGTSRLESEEKAPPRYTQSHLEALTKKELQAIAGPNGKGDKKALVKFILEKQEDANA